MKLKLGIKKSLAIFSGKKQRILSRLEGITYSLFFNPNHFFDKIQKKLWQEYEGIVVQQKFYWQQLSRSNNIKFGDKNTRYFHQRANGRRKRNKITALKNDSGECIDNVEKLKRWGVDFFKILYSMDSNYNLFPLSGCFPKLVSWDYADISKGVSQEEVKAAIFDMRS
ncbi:uncharacterized protein LOC107647195 [Arachis ipaensis]|uniref:uncharacterized protein LOC107647195 n=1 Tax=Arachis ipaensis TaxID=130454 RepID=UPI0007AEFBC9|nr:uncharacterized protein LOC107647195 [Arachis ipaensis]XP_025661799.1 uncharacterized protein LOC112757424 [Arachis hypogaea]